MEEITAEAVPDQVLILAEIVWRHQGHSPNFVVTSLEGFRGLCKHNGKWVSHRAITRESVSNITMLCSYKERKIAIAAFNAWPESDTNTYAIFDPSELPHVQAIPIEPGSGSQVFPSPPKHLNPG